MGQLTLLVSVKTPKEFAQKMVIPLCLRNETTEKLPKEH